MEHVVHDVVFCLPVETLPLDEVPRERLDLLGKDGERLDRVEAVLDEARQLVDRFLFPVEDSVQAPERLFPLLLLLLPLLPGGPGIVLDLQLDGRPVVENPPSNLFSRYVASPILKLP